MSTTKTTRTVNIERRGHFNDDSFFKDSWDEWDQAMKDAVNRWEDKTSDSTTTRRSSTLTSSVPAKETKTVYRKIRSSNVTSDDSQAVSCNEEDDKYKIVMDVKDFSPEHINVKAVDDMLVVEGHIEKKEGNSISTQKFVRRFTLPPGVNMNAVSSALSKDGVLTINAPKLAINYTRNNEEHTIPVHHGGDTITSRIMSSSPGRYTTTTHGFAAGKPSQKDNAPFNPTGGSNTTYYTTPTGRARVTETIMMDVPDRRSEHIIKTTTDSPKEWNSFDTMVERSQREMEDMMRNHTVESKSTVVAAPPNAASTKEVSRSGNALTEREEKRWDDRPAPGVNRTNRALSENTEIKDKHGNVIGHKAKKQHESKAEGEQEETLPDGTKRKIFTKSYETKNSYSSSSGMAKAL